jgi:four helix bundle protein
MTYQPFEGRAAWQAAKALGHGVYAVVKHRCFTGRGGLRDPLQRASLSVSNNIAEGFERGSSNELSQFLDYALGSAGEVRSALWFAAGHPEIAHPKS